MGSKSIVGAFGGLSSLGSLADSEIWLKKKQLSEVGGIMLVDVYCIGDFFDTVHARFASIAERDTSIGKLGRAKIELEGKPVWGRAHASPEIRVCEFF